MADWRDGPEYAPTQRPGGFVAPLVEPLDEPPAEQDPAAAVDAPAVRPEYEPMAGGGPALDSLQPPGPPRRDPQQAFDLASTPLTGGTGPDGPPPDALQPLQLSTPAAAPAPAPPPAVIEPAWTPPASAWTGAHVPQAGPRPAQDWAPQQPFQPQQGAPVSLPPPSAMPPPQINPQSFPAPDAQGWYAPYAPQQGPVGPRPVSVAELFRAATPGVAICLAVGGLIPMLAVPMMFVAHALASRVLYRRRPVSNVFRIVEGATAVLGLLGMFDSYGGFDLVTFYEQWGVWALLGNWILLVAVLLTVGAGMRAGEQPERPYP